MIDQKVSPSVATFLRVFLQILGFWCIVYFINHLLLVRGAVRRATIHVDLVLIL